MGMLDRLLQGQDIDDLLVECEEEESGDLDLEDLAAGGNGFIGYINPDGTVAGLEAGQDTSIPNTFQQSQDKMRSITSMFGSFIQMVSTTWLLYLVHVKDKRRSQWI